MTPNRDFILVLIVSLFVVQSTAFSNWYRRNIPEYGYELVGIARNNSGDKVAIGTLGSVLRYDGVDKEWKRQNSSTILNLNSVRFASENVVIAVGNSSIIIRSEDAGKNWSNVSGDSSEDLIALLNLSGGRIAAVGTDGLVLLSDDLGAEWTKSSIELNGVALCAAANGNSIAIGSSNGDVYYIEDMDNVESEVFGVHSSGICAICSYGGGWAATSQDGLIFRVENLPNDWQQVSGFQVRDDLGQIATAKKIDINAQGHGIVAGDFEGVFVSDDFGQSWKRPIRTNSPSPYPRLADFVGDAETSEFVAVGESPFRGVTIMNSMDAGNNWQYDVFESNIGPLTVLGAGGNEVYAVTRIGWNTLAVSGSNMLTAGDGGYIGRSPDGGASWEISSVLDGNEIVDVEILPSDDVVCVGNRGLIAWSDNFGQDWNKSQFDLSSLADDSKIVFRSIAFSGTTLWIAGEATVNDADRGVVLKSENAGRTWDRVQIPDAEFDGYNEIFFTSESVGYLFGSRRLNSPPADALKLITTDGGQSWNSYSVAGVANGAVSNFKIRSNGFGSAILTSGNQQSIITTGNNGNEWSVMAASITDIDPTLPADYSIKEVDFVNVDNGIVSLSGGTVAARIYQTDSGGAEWKYQPDINTPGFVDDTYSCVLFDSETSAWVVGTDMAIREYVPDATTSIDVPRQLETNQVTISPNPSAGFIRITLHGQFDSHRAELAIFDKVGRKALSPRVTGIYTAGDKDSSIIEVDVSQLESGVYFVDVVTRRTKRSHAFVIQR